MTSLVTTAIDFGVLMALVELFHVDVVIATFVGTVFGATSNFLINRAWSFSDHRGMIHWQLMRALPVQAGSSTLQTVGMWLLHDHAHVQYMTAKLIVAASVYLFWNYPMNRYFVFPRAKAQKDISREESAAADQRAV